MGTTKRNFGILFIGLVLAIAGVSVGAQGAAAFSQYPDDAGGPPLRAILDQTQNDLRTAATMEHQNSKERERYRNAQKSLSDFDRKLTKNKFDKGQLDKAIHDIQSVLDHNTLQVSSRDDLLRDVSQLREARRRHG
jgi:septal ring factor EnvC (AmiA/AmiB activator)